MATHNQARLIKISASKDEYPTIMRAIEDNKLSAGDIIYVDGWESATRQQNSFCIVVKLTVSCTKGRETASGLSVQFSNNVLGIPLLLCTPGWPWGLSDVAGPALLYDNIFAMDPKNPMYALLFSDDDPNIHQKLQVRYRAAGLLAL